MRTEQGPLRGPLRKRESHLWSRDEHDWYVEPAWCSARLFETEPFSGDIYDPACGLQTICKSAREAGHFAVGADLVTRSPGAIQRDFLMEGTLGAAQNIVCNPPFKHAEAFVARALNEASSKIAMLLPANWIQGDKRSRWLETTPLRRVYFLAPRPSMPPGAVVQAGGKPGNGTTDYAWFVWLQGYDGAPEIRWLRRDA